MVFDACPLVGIGLTAFLLRPPLDMEVQGYWTTMTPGPEVLRSHRPDLVIADLSFDDGDGIELIHQLRQTSPRQRILIYSSRDEVDWARRVIAAGALGFVMKKRPLPTLCDAIKRVLGGQRYLSERATNHLISGLVPGHAESPVEHLSERELEIFRMIGEGATNAKIAHRLGLRQKTINTHRDHIREKLQLKTSHDVMHFAIKWVNQWTNQ